MANPNIAGGVVHKLPDDLKKALLANPSALRLWQEKITPLARNEWICWTISVKQQKTRDDHVRRVISEINEGIRRPCCWVSCIHRPDKPISPSVRGVLGRRGR